MKRALVPVLAVVALTQCDALPEELRRLLGVEVTTTGIGLDPDGYVVEVDGDPALSKTIATNGTVTFEGLAAGAHTVRLSGVAPNCTVAGGAEPRTVMVASNGVAQVAFQVSCSMDAASTGVLEVEVRTSGGGLDLDGYAVTVDDAVTRNVAANGTITFENLAPGEHTVELSGIAGNCRSEVPVRQTVTVAADATIAVTFVVTCAGPGWLVVQAITTGAGADPDGYTVTVDDDPALRKVVAPNGSVVFEGLAPGEHTVRLGDLGLGCTVTEPNPQRVTVSADGVADATFLVSCDTPSQTGSLEVETRTTGSRIDRDGYIVTVDGSAPTRQAVAPNGSVLFDGLAVGQHTVLLSGVATNCTVLVPNPQTETVLANGVSTVTFLVSCPPKSGG